MPYKVYQATNGPTIYSSPTMRTGVAPGGTCMELGATDINGHDEAPITAIDWENKAYKRGGDWKEFPGVWYENSDIVWDD